jgi:hypothetical protein
VLARNDEECERRECLEEALELFHRKGNLVAADRAQALLAGAARTA